MQWRYLVYLLYLLFLVLYMRKTQIELGKYTEAQKKKKKKKKTHQLFFRVVF